MTRTRLLRRTAGALAGLAGALLTLNLTAPAAFSATTHADPPLPPGWTNHPALPARGAGAHTAVTGGMPGWQITLIAIASAVIAAALAVTATGSWPHGGG